MFKGSIPALITPFDDNGEVDFDQFSKFVDWQIKEGSHGLVPVGTTGESPTLTHEEHLAVVKTCVDVTAGRVPVIAGTGSNSTREAIALTQKAQNLGVSGALVVAPYYNKPSQEGLYQHFKAIHDASDVPIIVYNIPGRSVVDISVDTLARMFELPRIVGVKDATGDLQRCADQRAAMGEDFIQLSGEDGTALGFMAMGGRGCISVTANVAPKLCSEFQNACMVGDYAKALEIQDLLTPLHKSIFMEPSPAPVKYVGERLRLCTRRVRSPLVNVTDGLIAMLDKAMAHAGL
jgi:4-hydroxy-tetrahydrodipicolinate synthase